MTISSASVYKVESSKALSHEETAESFNEDRRKIEALTSNLSNIFVDAIAKNLSEFIQKDIQSRESSASPNIVQRGDDSVEGSKNNDIPKLYDLIQTTLKYHRDSYLVGPTYASIERIRRTGRYHAEQHPNRPDHFTFTNNLSIREESFASLQLQGFVNWFIPSDMMVNLVRPTVIWAVSSPISGSPAQSQRGGPLYTPLVQSVTNLIPLSQNIVDQILKDSVLNFLQSPETRRWVKGTTGGYVSRLQRDTYDQG